MENTKTASAYLSVDDVPDLIGYTPYAMENRCDTIVGDLADIDTILGETKGKLSLAKKFMYGNEREETITQLIREINFNLRIVQDTCKVTRQAAWDMRTYFREIKKANAEKKENENG